MSVVWRGIELPQQESLIITQEPERNKYFHDRERRERNKARRRATVVAQTMNGSHSIDPARQHK